MKTYVFLVGVEWVEEKDPHIDRVHRDAQAHCTTNNVE